MNEDIYLLLDDDLSDTDSAVLFRQLSENSQERLAFRQQLRLHSALSNNQHFNGLSATEDADLLSRLAPSIWLELAGYSARLMRFRPDPLPDMDIVAHSLWAGLGAVATARRWPVSASQALTARSPHCRTSHTWSPSSGGACWETARGRRSRDTRSKPGAEPWLPAAVQAWSHHLHCVMHSGVVASVATMIAWFRWRWLLVPLAGWWSHIVLDVFTHSSEYYSSPVLYPITQRGFDGIAWTTPWFMALNYAALAMTGLWLWRSSRGGRTR